MTTKQPQTMPHNFRLQPLRNHFNKEPLTSDAARLIDVPGDEFLDTEEELNVIGACLWMICVEYDRLGEEKMPKKREELRKWVTSHRLEVVQEIANKIEPPLPAWTLDAIEREVGGVFTEMAEKTVPSDEERRAKEKKEKEEKEKKDGRKGDEKMGKNKVEEVGKKDVGKKVEAADDQKGDKKADEKKKKEKKGKDDKKKDKKK